MHNKDFKDKYIHKQLDWSKFAVNNTFVPIFKGYNIVSKNDDVQSSYEGDYYVKPRGSLAKWKDLINQYVLGTNLEVAVIVGLSACVNAYIGRTIGYDNMIIHIMGESTTGKTTAGMLALSTASYPDQNLSSKESLFRTWNSTKNAMFQPLVGNTGFPVLFDEFSMNKDYSITDLVYALANGKDKSRLNKECEQRISSSFQTTIISTGEASLYNKCSNNTGLLVRIIEFCNIQWTESAEQSNTIKQGVRNNCGWAILEVAKYILTLDRKDILNAFDECKQAFLDNLLSVNNFSNRIATKYALLLLTTIISKKALGIDFNYDSILEMFLENE